MNLPDSFYIALCMTVLLVGAVYWVWTQIQYVQRKVNVLENIVYELKTLCSKPPPDLYPPPPALSAHRPITPPTTPRPFQEAEEEEEEIKDMPVDLLHQTLRKEIETLQAAQITDMSDTESHHEAGDAPSMVIEPFQEQEQLQEQLQEQSQSQPLQEAPFPATPMSEVGTDDLQPGGVGSGIVDTGSALETMTNKELKRLAQQRGVVGYSEMKKRDLITAIRALPSDGFSEM